MFPGPARWLEIAVRTNGIGGFFTLSPRQALTPAPYAITAGNVISGGLAAGAYGNAVSFNNPADTFTGAFAGNGLNISNVNAATLNGFSERSFWNIAGNTGTSPGANFLGTVDNQPVELRVNGERALRLEPVVNGSSLSNDVNVIGGSALNYVAPGVSAATISGGGIGSYFGARLTNSSASDFSVIGGGGAITIQTNATYAVISGGHLNAIENLAQESTISGGGNNTIHASANDSTISGGNLNSIETNSAQSTISGGYNNTVRYLTAYATIGGGGINTIQNGAYDSVIGGGYNNSVLNTFLMAAHDATIGGGVNNNNGGAFGTLGGGEHNSQFGFGGAIAGGANNYVGGDYGAISGGQSNQLGSFAAFSSIGGGAQNTNSGLYSVIGGGGLNFIDFNTLYSVIAGGGNNYINPGSSNATVAGGFGNFAAGQGAVVAGGEFNQALGVDSFAAGNGAQANADHSFVWSDGTVSSGFFSLNPNQFLIYASGGVGIGENDPRAMVGIGYATTNTPQVEIAQFNSSDYARLRLDVFNVPANPTWEMDVSPGAAPQLQFWISNAGGARMALDGGGNLTTAGTVNGTSDRNTKENFSPVSSRAVLDKVAGLPISEWNFKNDPDTRHIGPMAQDFYASFNVGMDDKHIATVDEGGVALAAIQGLNEKLEAENAELRRENKSLDRRIEALEKMVLKQNSN